MGSTPTRWIAAVAVLATAAVAFAQDDTIRVVALQGDEVDGLALTPSGGRDVLAIAGNGAVLFDGSTSAGVTYFHHLRSETSTVAVLGTPSPLPGYDTTSVEGVVMGRSGNVGYDAFYDGAPDVEARVTWFGRTTSLVAHAPGTFSDLQLGSWAFNGESFVFLGKVPMTRSAPRFDTQRAGMWRSFGGAAPVPLLQQDDPVPGLSDHVVDSISFSVPAVHESGATAFRVLGRKDSVTQARLVVFPAAGSAADPISLPGSEQMSFGTLPGGADFPPLARIVSDTSGLQVLDPGGAVAMTSGQVVGDKTLRLDSRSRLALCDGGQIVVMAHMEGATSGIEALWRKTPGAPLACELFVGQQIPDVSGELREITDIWNVHVNEQGRVAAELDLALFGTTQAIVIQDEAGGPFRVAVQQRATFAADRDEYEVTGIVSRRPTHFTFTGTGHDGRQSRFAPDGSFVFKARVDTADDPTDRNGIFVLSGPPKDLCDMRARVRRGHLEITAEDEGCRLTIGVTEGGEVFLRPGEGSSVNGVEGEQVFTFSRDLRISMRGGDDHLTILSEYGDGDTGDLPGNVVIDMGPGDDRLELDFLEVARSVKISMGRDAGIFESVELDGVGMKGSLNLACGPTRTECRLEGVDVEGKARVVHSGGRGTVTAQACGFFGKTQIVGSDDVNTIRVEGSMLFAPFEIDLGTGGLGSVRMVDCEGEGAKVTVDGGRGGAQDIELENVDLSPGKLAVKLGNRNSDLRLVGGTIVDDGIQVKTVPAQPQDPPHEIRMSNAFCESKLVVRGKGSHIVFLGANSHCAEGVDIKLKKGILDQITLAAEFQVENGDVKIQSKATGAAQINIDDVEIEGGRIVVRTGNGDDRLRVASAVVDDGVSAKLGDGDDTLVLGQVISFGGVVGDGGPGNDVFENATIDPEDLDDGIRTKNFELEQ